MAVMRGVNSIIAVHNHPSGNCEPSREDKIIKDRLQQAGDILGIKLLDFIIIAEDKQFVSLIR